DDRLTAWEQASGQKVPDDMFHVRRAPVNLYKTDSRAMADLVERVEREGYVAVVFDTLQRCSTGADSNSTRDAGQIVASLDRVRDATNEGSVGVVAHSDKSDRDTRGSSAFEDDADIVVRVKKDEDTQSVTVTLDKRRDGPAGKTWELQPFKPPYAPSIVLEARGAQPKNTKPPSQAYPALVQLSKPVFKDDGASVTALQLALGLGGKGSIYPALNYLLDEGLASKHGPRTSVRYKITVQGWSALERAEGNDR